MNQRPSGHRPRGTCSTAGLLVLSALGVWPLLEARAFAADEATPWVGTWLRINVGVLFFCLIVIVSALLRPIATLAFGVLLAGHGLIHLIGTGVAFGWKTFPAMAPISPAWGIVWLAAGLLFVASAGLLWLWPRGVAPSCAAAIVVSMMAVVHSWTDARFGAVMNAVVFLGLLEWLRRGYETASSELLDRHERSGLL